MGKKIVITGSDGFIGRVLTSKLIEKGYAITEFNLNHGDITKTNLDFPGIDHIFHLAGKTFIPESWVNPVPFFEVNALGTLRILEFCRKQNVSLTYISAYVYGIPRYLPVNEDHPVSPFNPYTHSKIVAEELCEFYRKNHKMKIAVIRPFNIYGPGQSDFFLIPLIIGQLLDKSKKFIELQDLSPKRDYLYIDDLIDALVLLFEKNKFDTYNIGSGISYSVKEIADCIFKQAGISKKIITANNIRKNEIPDVVADITKINRDTGWKPKISFEEGIRRILHRYSATIL
ncbi:MAG: GDP-mannose 4,6-dehydratase [Bacteroidetes bacterium]|nr:GDP-mannose 4,6-dehydratase [Bacteroidota bacterium]